MITFKKKQKGTVYPVAALGNAANSCDGTEFFKSMLSHIFKVSLMGVTVFFAGCISATNIYYNDEISDETREKTYGEVYFLSPAKDPRGLTPRIMGELTLMGYNVMEMDREEPLEGLQGSGFFISDQGYIITCAHVLDGSDTATVWWEGQRFEADSIASDNELDLEILKLRQIPDEPINPLYIDVGAELNMGDEVLTIGYPMTNILGDQARLTEGIVSASQGFMGNDKQFQISAPIQPGNSGGPVFDKSGKVNGVVTQTLNTLAVIEQTGGAAPQNANFALKPSYLKAFIQLSTDKDILPKAQADSRDIGSVKNAVVKVRSGIISANLENKPKLVILFDYNGYWDLWYRFNAFLITAFDFDTGEHIFTAGQMGDNLISNEEVVIVDTLDKVRVALQK